MSILNAAKTIRNKIGTHNRGHYTVIVKANSVTVVITKTYDVIAQVIFSNSKVSWKHDENILINVMLSV